MSIEEAGDKCLGQEGCNSCPRYMDDCDGQDYACKQCFKEFKDEDYIEVLEDRGENKGKETITAGVKCSGCGFKEEF